LRWQSMAYSDEHHGSIRFKSIYDGLKFTYFGFSSFMLDFFPMDGILVKNKPASIMLYSTYLDYNPGIRYTTDGSEPTTTAARYEYGIRVSAPAELTLKQFSNWGPDKIAKGHFRVGNVLPPTPKPAVAMPGGLHYTYYEGSWDQMPNFNRLHPMQSGRADQAFSVSHFTDKSPFACLLEGFLEVQKSGYYIFFLEADSAARLRINDTSLIEINVSRDKVGSKSFVVPLKKGFYPIRLEYFHKTGERNLRHTYLPPSPGEERLARLPINI